MGLLTLLKTQEINGKLDNLNDVKQILLENNKLMNELVSAINMLIFQNNELKIKIENSSSQ